MIEYVYCVHIQPSIVVVSENALKNLKNSIMAELVRIVNDTLNTIYVSINALRIDDYVNIQTHNRPKVITN